MAPSTDRSSEGARGEGPAPGALSALLDELARTPRHDGRWEAALHPGDVIGRFELVREIARGGFGIVWEARDRTLQRTVAFKALRLGDRREIGEERLLAEAEAAARLSHPNIVTLHDVGRTPHGPYLVLEFLRGRTLAARLADGPLPPAEALRIAAAVACGLAHAHAHGVVHRDLTPGNVFLCHDRQVKVLDLGMAHAFGHRKLDGGTPAYMAPEQRRGGPEDERTDVFALGVLLYQMLTGVLPFSEGASIRARAAELDVRDAPAVGPFVARMLSPDPVDRPRDASAVLPALEAFHEEVGRSVRGSGRSVRTRRRGFRLGALVGAAALAAALAAAVALRQTRHDVSSSLSSIAVLPFADLSPHGDQGYFSEGVAEEILNALSRIDGLRVAGRASSFSFRSRDVRVGEVGRQLGVDALLEGSVRREGKRIRITAEIVKVADGYRIWSQEYDRDLTDVLSVQDDIARTVAEALRVQFLPRRGTGDERRPRRPEAYDEYLLGRQAANLGSVDDRRRAERAFLRALAIDPEYAPTFAALAEVRMYLADDASSAEDVAAGERAALDAAERALALDPDLAQGYAIRALLRSFGSWDWTAAEADILRAMTLAPGDPQIMSTRSILLAAVGRLDEGIAMQRRATELDRLSARAFRRLGLLLLCSGDLIGARAALERALELAPHNDATALLYGSTFLVERRPGEALAAYRRVSAPVYQRIGLALAEHDLGHAQAADTALAELEERFGHSAAAQIAMVYAWRGDADHAFAWAERAVRQHDPGLWHLKIDPLFRKLHGDPRFSALLRRLNLPVD